LPGISVRKSQGILSDALIIEGFTIKNGFVDTARQLTDDQFDALKLLKERLDKII